jgi:DNA polymerase-4
MTSAPTRSLPTILHIDMDAFFVSCELNRQPELRGRPVVVGGTGERGVVAAASYEARSYGVHSAMPSVRALRLCPHAVFLRGDHAYYAEVSGRVMQIFRDATPLVEPLSLDEAFLDVAGAARSVGSPVQIADTIRSRVQDEEHLTCAVGASAVKFIAKLASDDAKPRPSRAGPIPGLGVKVVLPGQELRDLHPLPVERLWGVGPSTKRRLDRLGVRIVADLAALPLETLRSALGDAHGRHLHALAHGLDWRRVEPSQRAKSVGHEETYPHDLRAADEIGRELVRMSDSVGARLRSSGVAGRTVTLKVRFGDFTTITRSATLADPVDSGPVIARAAKTLLASIDPSPGVRLAGVSVSGLTDQVARQLSLDSLFAAGVEGRAESVAAASPIPSMAPTAPTDQAWSEADEAIDAIRARFGSAAIGPAAAVGDRGLRLKRSGDQQWGPDAPRSVSDSSGDPQGSRSSPNSP